MSLGRRQAEQKNMWLIYDQLPQSQGHVFYERLQKLLHQKAFDAFLEKLCAPFYAEKPGRRSIPPGRYFRMLLIGYFEGIDSERGICWRCADSLSLREFLGLGPPNPCPTIPLCAVSGGACRWKFITKCLSLCCGFWSRPICLTGNILASTLLGSVVKLFLPTMRYI